MKVAELKGYKAWRAFGVFHKLMLGLKMLPAYMGESYEEFFERVSLMPAADQEKLIREAALFVDLEQDEVEHLLHFCSDPNGVPYSSENLKSLSPDQIFEIVVAVSKEIAKIKVDFLTENEKKNLKTSL
jgi:hypothetical protein